MAQQSFRNSQLVEFKNTAAGHDGVLSDPSGSLIIKPCKPSEISFYQSTSAHPDFCRYIPTFMGSLSLTDKDPAKAAAALMESIDINGPVNVHNGISDVIAVEDAWTPSGGGKIATDCAIAMENVAYGYKKPNILDVKLGARLWADDAPPPKRTKLDKVAGETTSKTLGFRVAGMRTWQGSQAAGQEGVNEEGYKSYDKEYGRLLTVENVVNGFEDYFRVAGDTKPPKNIRKIIRRFSDDLKELRAVLEKEESRMYSASLLFVYEGDPEALDEAFVTEKQIFDSLTVTESHELTSTKVHTTDHKKNGINGGTTTTPDGVTTNTTVNGPSSEEPSTVNGNATDSEDDEAILHLPKIQDLKLIDFAHADWTPGQGSDENLLHGIRNVIKTLEGLVPVILATPNTPGRPC